MTIQTTCERKLKWIAIALVAAIFTRYDGWILALISWTSIGIWLLRRGRLRSRVFWIASAVIVAAPIAWFVYNALAFGDWLEFARGPYSAQGYRIAHGKPWRRTATSRLAQSVGWAAVLRQSVGDGCGRGSVGQQAADRQCAWHCVGLA